MGLDADRESAAVTETGQTTNVTLTCRFQDKTVYNCTVNFMFTTESLLLIDGRRPLEQGESKSGAILDAATILMRFLSETRENGMVYNRVEQMEPGYVMEASAAGEGEMTPIWRITTDVGVHYINGLTGKSENLA